MARHISTTRPSGPLLDTAAILLAATTALAAIAAQTHREGGRQACAPAPAAVVARSPAPPDQDAELHDMLLHD